MWLALLGLAAAWAGTRADLDAGDRAWAAADRPAARAAWRRAAEAPDPAVQAQAEARLLLVGGNLGLAVHGPRAEAALARCLPPDPWCALAAADLVLFGRALGVPLDLAEAREAATAARAALPGPALARLVWAGAEPLAALPAAGLDGLGEAVRQGGGRFPPGPGTWTLGLGVVGASGQGVGGAVRLVHPDLGLQGWRLDLEGLLTSRGVGRLGLGLASPGTWWGRGSAAGARAVADVYEDGERILAQEVWVVSGTLQGGWRGPHAAAWLGPVARQDGAPGAWLAGHGVGGGLRLDQRDDGLGAAGGLSGELALADYRHQELGAWARHVSAEGRLALGLRAEAAPGSAAPYWRLPAAGGGQVLRHGPVSRFRAPALAAAMAEVRLRPTALLGFALFGEGAWIAGPHGGLGGGLRLRLPPRPHNTVRLDVAWGDGGIGVSAGWGEAF